MPVPSAKIDVHHRSAHEAKVVVGAQAVLAQYRRRAGGRRAAMASDETAGDVVCKESRRLRARPVL
eukprot:3377932-Pleurochrysis_carterae.AAC.1